MLAKLFEREDRRIPQTKWFGLLAVIGIPLGWSLMEFDFGHRNFITLIPMSIGTVGYLLVIRSIYFSSRDGTKDHADERQKALYFRAGTYAFRGLVIILLLALLYATIASQPARQWWLPSSTEQFAHLLIPLGIVLPILPAVISEWLDPATKSEDEF